MSLLAGFWLAGALPACSTDASELVSGAAPSDPLQIHSPPASDEFLGAETVAPSHAPTAQPEPDPPLPRPNRPGVPDTATQAILVTTPAWKAANGRLLRFERDDGRSPWGAVDDDPARVSVGRYGLAWGRGLHPTPAGGPLKFEGDHRSPAGVFDLGEARGYAEAPPEGTTWPFQHSGRRWRCMDNPRSSAYNTFMPTRGLPLPVSAGIAPRETVFDLMIFVMHNTAPVLRGAGSCVFLHVWAKPDHPTQGCVAMARDDLADVLVWLDLDRRPVLVQLPAPVHEQVRRAWALPPLIP